MAQKRDPGEENIRALEDLRLAASGSAKPGQRNPPPPPSAADNAALYPEVRPAPAVPSKSDEPRPGTPRLPGHGPTPQPSRRSDGRPDYHCLHCGYGLFSETSYRCSECGTQYDAGFLSAWFEGSEATRFANLTWTVNIALVLKAWTLVVVVTLAMGAPQTCYNMLVMMVGAGCAIAACAWAGRDRMDTVCGYYAIGGMAAGGLLVLGILFGGLNDKSRFMLPALVFAMDSLCGAMLLLSMVHSAGKVKLLGAPQMRAVALPVAIVTPPLAFLLYAFESKYRAAVASSGGTVPALLNFFNTTTLMAAVSVGVWVYARQWLVGFRRLVFSPVEEEDET
ncbi:MAG: hypothetical protein HZB38_16460 [Planctomycetes bacterium]|nr:hypothetical protein [Planctomycetota bacterium]